MPSVSPSSWVRQLLLEEVNDRHIERPVERLTVKVRRILANHGCPLRHLRAAGEEGKVAGAWNDDVLGPGRKCGIDGLSMPRMGGDFVAPGAPKLYGHLDRRERIFPEGEAERRRGDHRGLDTPVMDPGRGGRAGIDVALLLHAAHAIPILRAVG